MSDAGDLDLNTLNDEELVQQVHDDLYDGLKEEVEAAVHIFLKRGWTPYKILTEAVVPVCRQVVAEVLGPPASLLRRNARLLTMTEFA